MNEDCKSNVDCNPGLRCAASKCTSLLKINETGCLIDFDCVASAGCNLTTSASGMCVEYFSLDKGMYLNECKKTKYGGTSNLCKTGVCLYISLYSSRGICAEAPIAVGTNPVQCTKRSQCIGKTEKSTYFTDCECGKNSNGTSYCTPFFGDLQYIRYINSFRTFMKSQALDKCNTERRFSNSCWKMTTGQNYTNLWFADYEYANYPYLVNNDACVKTVYFTDYYSKTYSTSISLILGYLAMLVLS